MTLSGLGDADVTTFIGERLGGKVSSLQRLKHGQWSTAFSFSCAGRRYVIRFSTTEEDFRKDQRAMRYASAALSVPKIVDLGVAFDGFFAISEHLNGAFLDDIDGVAMRRTLPALFAALDKMRLADISATSGFGVWSADGTAPHRTWREALVACGMDSPGMRTLGWSARLAERPDAERVFHAAFAELHRQADRCPNERYLVHSDLLAYNVLVDVAAERISAVLDWGSSLYGDFLWDLAWLTFWQPWYTAWGNIDFRAEAHRHYAAIGLQVPNFEARMRCCELAIGLDGMAYQAFRGRWQELAETARRLEGLV